MMAEQLISNGHSPTTDIIRSYIKGDFCGLDKLVCVGCQIFIKRHAIK